MDELNTKRELNIEKKHVGKILCKEKRTIKDTTKNTNKKLPEQVGNAEQLREQNLKKLFENETPLQSSNKQKVPSNRQS